MGFDINDSISFSKEFSKVFNSLVVINMVFDSDDAISIIIKNGEVIKALSNRKKNINKIKNIQESKEFIDLDVIWKKRNKIKEHLIMKTADFFKDDSKDWLKNQINFENDYLIAYKSKLKVTKHAESTSPPRIIWGGSQGIYLRDQELSDGFDISETFTNIGKCFKGVVIKIIGPF